jgi:hypothetical protein
MKERTNDHTFFFFEKKKKRNSLKKGMIGKIWLLAV